MTAENVLSTPKPLPPTIIGLAGEAGHGKGVIADHLVQKHKFKRVKLAGVLKAMLTLLYVSVGYDHDECRAKIEGPLKDEPCEVLGGKTPRFAMQTLGTEWGRNCIGEEFWVTITAATCRAYGGRIVIDDVRFPNEVMSLKAQGGAVVGVTRKDVQRLKSTDEQHESEAYIGDLPLDEVLTNDGTVDELTVKVDKLLPSWLQIATQRREA